MGDPDNMSRQLSSSPSSSAAHNDAKHHPFPPQATHQPHHLCRSLPSSRLVGSDVPTLLQHRYPYSLYCTRSNGRRLYFMGDLSITKDSLFYKTMRVEGGFSESHMQVIATRMFRDGLLIDEDNGSPLQVNYSRLEMFLNQYKFTGYPCFHHALSQAMKAHKNMTKRHKRIKYESNKRSLEKRYALEVQQLLKEKQERDSAASVDTEECPILEYEI